MQHKVFGLHFHVTAWSCNWIQNLPWVHNGCFLQWQHGVFIKHVFVQDPLLIQYCQTTYGLSRYYASAISEPFKRHMLSFSIQLHLYQVLLRQDWYVWPSHLILLVQQQSKAQIVSILIYSSPTKPSVEYSPDILELEHPSSWSPP